MNEFEKRINALRLQYKAEQRMITKDAHRTIGRLNNAIGAVRFPEAREAMRAEKARVYEAMRASHEYNTRCYHQQLELLNDEHTTHLQRNPSNRAVRLMMSRLCEQAAARGMNSLSLSFGDNRRCEVRFS